MRMGHTNTRLQTTVLEKPFWVIKVAHGTNKTLEAPRGRALNESPNVGFHHLKH